MRTKRKIISQQLLFQLLFFFIITGLSAQTRSMVELEKELVKLSLKIPKFRDNNVDSLEFYSNSFSTKMNDAIANYPETMNYPFQMLKDSNVCNVLNSADGRLRIYSCNTWMGGSISVFQNTYQFKTGSTIHSKNFGSNEDYDIGYYHDLFTMKASGKTYYLAVSHVSETTKDGFETIQVYTIDGNSLNDSVPLIKTKKGLSSSLSFNYNFLSVAKRPERPVKLFKYDPDRKVIYVPIVMKDGKVTNRLMPYQFKGTYFEYGLTSR